MLILISAQIVAFRYVGDNSEQSSICFQRAPDTGIKQQKQRNASSMFTRF